MKGTIIRQEGYNGVYHTTIETKAYSPYYECGVNVEIGLTTRKSTEELLGAAREAMKALATRYIEEGKVDEAQNVLMSLRWTLHTK